MGRRIYRHRYRRRAGSPEFFSVLAALVVLSLTGANATVGDYSFTLRVTDASNASATASFTLHVNPRTVVNTDLVILDDLLNTHAGAVIRSAIRQAG